MVPPPTGGLRRRKREPSPSLEWVLAGRAFLRGRLQPVEIGIDAEGMIVAIAKNLPGARHHDVADGIIIPSATDLHVHFREPGGPADVENFGDGTIQAALGGIGLVGEMPNTSPPTTDLERLRDKVSLCRGRLAVDVLLYAGLTKPSRVTALAKQAGAFKLYLSPTAGVESAPQADEIPPLIERVASSGLALSVHAEDPRTFRVISPIADPVDWNAHRPPAAEMRAVEGLLPSPAMLRLHLAHVTTKAAVELLEAQGQSFEATPHHLLLSARRGETARLKVNPPLRSEADRRALWEAFTAGKIPCLASDHAPHASNLKAESFSSAPSGMPGVETLLPLFLAQVRAQNLTLPVLLSAACDRPARWFGCPQGRIAVGHRANLLVVDFRNRSKLSGRTLHAPCGWTAFEGWEGIFPREHFLGGERIVDAGEYVGRPMGRTVRPEYAPSPHGR